MQYGFLFKSEHDYSIVIFIIIVFSMRIIIWPYEAAGMEKKLLNSGCQSNRFKGI